MRSRMLAAEVVAAVPPRAAPGTMSDTASKPIAIPRSTESRGGWRNASPQADEPRGKPVLQATHRQQDAVAGLHRPAARMAEDIELGMAEIQRIMQALREMSESALHRNVCGDVLCIPDSPNLGFLSAEFDGFENLDERRTSPASDQTNY